MSRRHKHTAHANHERWLVSYADFITLLFAFFVVMFASGQTDKSKARQVSESVREGLEDSKLSAAISAMMAGNGGAKRVTQSDIGNHTTPQGKPGHPKPEEKKESLEPSYQQLSIDLKKEIESGKIKISLEPRGLVISLREAAYFPSGGDAIPDEMWDSIDRIGAAIGRVSNSVRLEGHTDSQPIHSARFRSNWELSAARSIAMLDILTDRCHLDHARFAIAGYADTSPVDTNDTAEGRAHNRRVDVVILKPGENSNEPAPKETAKR